MASIRKSRKNHALQRSASTLTSNSTNSSKSTFSRIWGSFRRSQSSHSVSEGFKPLGHHMDVGHSTTPRVEIIKSISELDNSVVSFNHGNVETIPPGEYFSHTVWKCGNYSVNKILREINVAFWQFFIAWLHFSPRIDFTNFWSDGNIFKVLHFLQSTCLFYAAPFLYSCEGANTVIRWFCGQNGTILVNICGFHVWFLLIFCLHSVTNLKIEILQCYVCTHKWCRELALKYVEVIAILANLEIIQLSYARWYQKHFTWYICLLSATLAKGQKLRTKSYIRRLTMSDLRQVTGRSNSETLMKLG